MAIRAGVGAFKASKKENEQRRARGFSGETFRFMLKDGEEAPVRFLGLFRPAMSKETIKTIPKDELGAFVRRYAAYRRVIDDVKESSVKALFRRMKEIEPVMKKEHLVRQSASLFKDFVCDEGPKCVGCHQNKAKNKAVGWPRDKSCFSLYDFRKQHKVEGQKGNEYLLCTEDSGICKLCKRASEKGPVFPAKTVGKRKWEVGVQVATTIITLHERLSRRCAACKTGKIKVTAYACAACGEPLPNIDDSVEGLLVRCGECKAKTQPAAVLACSGCDDPFPGSITDYPCTIIRSGSGKDDTQYNIEVGPTPEKMPLVALKAGCVLWSEEHKPLPTAEQAALCMLKSDPFGGGNVGGEDYDDDAEDEDEDERPRKKTKSKARNDDDDLGVDEEDDDD